MDFVPNKLQILCSSELLDLKKTFDSGQCFRWEADGEGQYIGVASGRVLRIWQDAKAVFCDAPEADLTFWRHYFDLDTDYTESLKLFSKPDYLRQCRDYGLGIRILRQEPWEALVSFIISQCNNIPRIKGIISALCSLFGEPLEAGIFSFPSPQRLAPLSLEELGPIKSGYRAKYILSAARAIVGGSFDLEGLSALSADEAFARVCALQGVGVKVANCFLLYGLHKLERFPVDVWMRRALDRYFPPDFEPSVLGEHAGLAQQFIFYYIRAHGQADERAQGPTGKK